METKNKETEMLETLIAKIRNIPANKWNKKIEPTEYRKQYRTTKYSILEREYTILLTQTDYPYAKSQSTNECLEAYLSTINFDKDEWTQIVGSTRFDECSYLTVSPRTASELYEEISAKVDAHIDSVRNEGSEEEQEKQERMNRLELLFKKMEQK